MFGKNIEKRIKKLEKREKKTKGKKEIEPWSDILEEDKKRLLGDIEKLEIIDSETKKKIGDKLQEMSDLLIKEYAVKFYNQEKLGKKFGIVKEVDEDIMANIALRKGKALELLMSDKKIQKKYKDHLKIRRLNILRDAIRKDKVPLEAQFLILNTLNEELPEPTDNEDLKLQSLGLEELKKIEDLSDEELNKLQEEEKKKRIEEKTLLEKFMLKERKILAENLSGKDLSTQKNLKYLDGYIKEIGSKKNAERKIEEFYKEVKKDLIEKFLKELISEEEEKKLEKVFEEKGKNPTKFLDMVYYGRGSEFKKIKGDDWEEDKPHFIDFLKRWGFRFKKDKIETKLKNVNKVEYKDKFKDKKSFVGWVVSLLLGLVSE